MRRAVVLWVLVAVSVAIFLFLYKSTRLDREVRMTVPFSKARVGDPAPDFVLPALGGGTLRLADYRGKVVFLNFWATWCPPCRSEIPSMESLYKRFGTRDFDILAVSIDDNGEGAVRGFGTAYGITFPVLLDPQRTTYALYGLTGVPETFIIDRDGKIVFKVIGPQDWMNRQWIDYFDRVTQQR